LPDVQMTSVAGEGVDEGLACLSKRVAYRLAQGLGYRQRLVTPRRIGAVPVAA
jgi:hypothetical protein